MSDMLERLQAANPDLDIRPVSDPAFRRYGRLLAGYDPAELIERARRILPESDAVVYEPSVRALEQPCAFNEAIIEQVYGGMPVQVGWCYGRNLAMNALEYHRGSEVNVCLSDVVLLVGHVQDIAWPDDEAQGPIRYETEKVAAFYAPAGSVVELSPWNLHYAPIHCQEGASFATLVYLPRTTNEPLPFRPPNSGESRLLFAINKWLLAHPDVQALKAEGAYPGLAGEDIVITPATADEESQGGE